MIESPPLASAVVKGRAVLRTSLEVFSYKEPTAHALAGLSMWVRKIIQGACVNLAVNHTLPENTDFMDSDQTSHQVA